MDRQNDLVSANDAVLSPAVMSEPSAPDAVRLVDPEVPADQGLSSLGLLMQLAGSVFAAYATLMTFVILLSPGAFARQRGWLLLVLGICVARSLFQRIAGSELLYGKRTLEGTASPMSGLHRYILIALIQTVVLVAILVLKLELPTRFGIAFGAGLAAWPVTLAVLLRLPRFRRFETEIPVSEDKGFEAASILMVVLGTCGVLGTGAALVMMLEGGSQLLSQGPGVLLLLATVMLVIRSGLHVQAGLSGLRETSVDRSVELANRYANFGVISSFCTGGALLLLTMMSGLHIAMLVVVTGLCWLLMAWPMIIRRFFSERQFADLMAGDNADVHRRAPDAGLTGLGWLLLANGVFGATMLIPQLVMGSDGSDNKLLDMLAYVGPLATRSLWWSAGLVMLQVWAGFELIRMGATHRVIATVYAVVAAAVSVYLMWPVLQSLEHARFMGPEAVIMFVPLAIQLVIPVATLILVNRKIAPTARARFRPRPAAPPESTPA